MQYISQARLAQLASLNIALAAGSNPPGAAGIKAAKKQFWADIRRDLGITDTKTRLKVDDVTGLVSLKHPPQVPVTVPSDLLGILRTLKAAASAGVTSARDAKKTWWQLAKDRLGITSDDKFKVGLETGTLTNKRTGQVLMAAA